jgi:cytochrome c
MIKTMSSALAADPPEGPNLGHPVTEENITRRDMSIMPDGEGLPEGQGSVAEGEALYKQHCVSCHGQGGLGNSGDQLAGAIHSLTDEWPEKTIGTYWPYATTLFDFTRRSMPMNAPGTLTNAEVYALVAYMLFLNGIVEEDTVMNAKALKLIEMPNDDGFINVYDADKPDQ